MGLQKVYADLYVWIFFLLSAPSVSGKGFLVSIRFPKRSVPSALSVGTIGMTLHVTSSRLSFLICSMQME